MPEITQRVYSRMVTEVEVTFPNGGFRDTVFVTTEPLMIPAGVKITFEYKDRNPGEPEMADMIFEQDLDFTQEPEGEPVE